MQVGTLELPLRNRDPGYLPNDFTESALKMYLNGSTKVPTYLQSSIFTEIIITSCHLVPIYRYLNFWSKIGLKKGKRKKECMNTYMCQEYRKIRRQEGKKARRREEARRQEDKKTRRQEYRR